MGQVRLFGAWGSSMTWRVETVLKLKGIEYEFIEEDLSNKCPLLLQYNLVHKKVPVFVHVGKAIAESLVIIDILKKLGNMVPPCFLKTLMRKPSLVSGRSSSMKSAFLRRACSTAGKEREKAKEEAIEQLKYLDNEIKGKRFFGGDAIGFVDIAADFSTYRYGLISEVVGLELITKDKLPNLCKWIDEYIDYSFVKENLPDRERLIEIYKFMFLGSSAAK